MGECRKDESVTDAQDKIAKLEIEGTKKKEVRNLLGSK